MHIQLKNPATGQLKEIKVGWSWPTFLFASFFGIPLLISRLFIPASIMIILNIVNIVTFMQMSNGIDPITRGIATILFLVLVLTALILSVYFALSSNKMATKHYLKNGWQFIDPDSEIAKMTMLRWGIK